MHSTMLSIILFYFLLYVAKGSSSLSICEKRTILNRISNLARVNLTHAWSTIDSLPSNRLLLIPVHGSGPFSPTTENHHIFVVAVLQHNIYIFLSLRESGRYVHLLGRSVTRLTAYHIYSMWLVLSNA